MSADDQGLDIKDIQACLPHRYPFLLVDRVEKIVPGEWIEGVKNVSISEPFFVGHFPDYPVMPGVLIIEALAQIAAILGIQTQKNQDESGGGQVPVLARIDNARFFKPVVAGDQLILRAEIASLKRNFARYKTTASVAGQPVCSADIMGARVDQPAS